MGSGCRIVAPDMAAATIGEAMVHDLEQRWSRFLPGSEINALNALDGRLGIVSAETYELVACAERARQATGGAFNPLMLTHLERAGYDRTWARIADSDEPVPAPLPVCDEPIELFPEVRGVRLPTGARFDPGGIGKGLAGDLVAAELTRLGAATCQVELGGDVRVAGPAWTGGWWNVRVADNDADAVDVASVTLPQGGVATSSSVRRSWHRAGVRMHHLIDPTTGLPAHTDLATATVVAPTLWWAEVVAKIAVIAGRRRGRALIDRLGMSGVLVSIDGAVPSESIVARPVAA